MSERREKNKEAPRNRDAQDRHDRGQAQTQRQGGHSGYGLESIRHHLRDELESKDMLQSEKRSRWLE